MPAALEIGRASQNKRGAMITPERMASLADSLRRLGLAEPRTKSDLKQWKKDATSVMLELRRDDELRIRLPEVLWHYLDDVGLRYELEDFAAEQRAAISKFIEGLERGEILSDRDL